MGGFATNGVRMTDEELTCAYNTYCDMVYRIALVQTKSRSQAEDIQQDVFLALVRYSDRIRSEEHLKAWLIRVTQCACKKHFRSLWIKLVMLYDDTFDRDTGPGLPEPKDPGGYPGQEDDDHPLDDLVLEQVEALPESSRSVIHLFYYENLSVREIAGILRISEQNVKTRLSRAREKLRQQLEGKISYE